MRPLRRLSILLSVLFATALAGCASAPPDTTYYLLRGELSDSTQRVDAKIRAGVGRVVVASYLLSSRGVMLETGDGEITPAIRHQWAEPLDAGLRWYLRTQIGSELGEDIGGGVSDLQRCGYSIDIVVAQLHGTMEGTALMEAAFIVVPTDASQPISEYRFAKTIPLPRDGYAGVVEAEKSLATDFASLIAQALRERLTP
jgi:uncharacterized lipoprotein YmbA